MRLQSAIDLLSSRGCTGHVAAIHELQRKVRDLRYEKKALQASLRIGLPAPARR